MLLIRYVKILRIAIIYLLPITYINKEVIYLTCYVIKIFIDKLLLLLLLQQLLKLLLVITILLCYPHDNHDDVR